MRLQVAELVQIAYRATGPGGGDVEIRFVGQASRATAADAYDRLSSRYGSIDPATIEIETRPLPPTPFRGVGTSSLSRFGGFPPRTGAST